MKIKYEIRNANSSYSDHELEFKVNENKVQIDGGTYFTNEIIKALQGINEIQISNNDLTLNQMETKINGLLFPPTEIDKEGDNDYE